MKKIINLLAIMLCLTASAHAQQFYTSGFFHINRLGSYSSVYPSIPTLQGYVRVFFAQPQTWTLPVSCDTQNALIREGDKQLVAAVHAAMLSDRPVQVFSDDAIAPVQTMCIITYLQY